MPEPQPDEETIQIVRLMWAAFQAGFASSDRLRNGEAPKPEHWLREDFKEWVSTLSTQSLTGDSQPDD